MSQLKKESDRAKWENRASRLPLVLSGSLEEKRIDQSWLKKVEEQNSGSNRKGRRDDRTDKNAIRLPSNACETTYLFHPLQPVRLLYYWGRRYQLEREKEKKDETDRGTTEIQSAYLTAYLVLVVTDYSMSSCCMSIILNKSCCCLIRVSTNLLD